MLAFLRSKEQMENAEPTFGGSRNSAKSIPIRTASDISVQKMLTITTMKAMIQSTNITILRTPRPTIIILKSVPAIPDDQQAVKMLAHNRWQINRQPVVQKSLSNGGDAVLNEAATIIISHMLGIVI